MQKQHSLPSRVLGLILSFLFSSLSITALAQNQILISGAGPAGLATAVMLQRQGHNVLLVEERDEEKWGTRTQVLGLSKESKNYWNN